MLAYGTDSEHDQRVRRRLAELAAERGSTVEEVLQEIDARLAVGQPPGVETSAAASACPAPEPHVVRRRSADDVWGVVGVGYDGPSAAPRRPCTGQEPCPWRRDAPLGQFPAEAFVHSAPGNRTGGPSGRFGCHSSTPARPLLCAGWLLSGADGNDEILGMMDAGVLARPELPDGVELYESYAEMAVANGVAPDLPALHARPVPAEDLADLVLLHRFFEDHYALEDTLAAGWTVDLELDLKRSMPRGALLGLVLDCDGTVLELGLLRVSIGHRGQGHAARVLARICAEADARELTVVCTPTDEFGADRARLEAFYRRHGFAPAAPGNRLTAHSWQRPPAHPQSR
ncbi:DUF6283 family protein [Streptomyces acidiscabies]|uniref:DUF6283 family protein n=1 Tax=Streptomyces acidiscabies TaxID=42234 RepID=A0ABU4LX68_9ACTN|nr:DUF6283 family protein [Streptomyces acidiscabies]MDX3020072.1 DUF6283 family protein [Streptomyces acidiscabies]